MGCFTDKLDKLFRRQESGEEFIRAFANEPDSHYIRAPLEEIVDSSHVETCLDMLFEMLRGYEDVAFIGGGFPAYVLKTTTKYTDIDIWCANDQVYNELQEYVATNPKWTDRYLTKNGLTKFTVRRQDENGNPITHNFDLVDLYARLEYFQVEPPKDGFSSVEDILRAFDLSWAMVGIDLKEEEIVFHELATHHVPYLNEKKLAVMTDFRLNKYHERMRPMLKEKKKDCSKAVRVLSRYLSKHHSDDDAKGFY